ncbi:glycosyltransferase family 2 protein [Cyanobacteria bacterium FACHB-63]|nr:glycosyltransferase family 2 protein [Cyanobacteria bacterium FACHB-63]
MTTIDIVIPAYNEKAEALEATLLGCLQQSMPASKIFVIDDCSVQPISIPKSCADPRISLARLPFNAGISIARNTAIQKSSAEFIACINVEVVPETDWLQVCIDYLKQHSQVGACFTVVVPHKIDIFSQWKMRFHEIPYGTTSRQTEFAPGNAGLFRREALQAVKGYRAEFQRILEDRDICVRMQEQGWETHYVAKSRCLTIQKDTWLELARKQVGRQGFELEREYSFLVFFQACLWDLCHRLGRNLFKGRIKFIFIDFAVFFGSVLLFIRTRPTTKEHRWSTKA